MKKILSIIFVSLLLSVNAYAQDLNFICTSPDKASDKTWSKSNIRAKFKFGPKKNKGLFYSNWHSDNNEYSIPLAFVEKTDLDPGNEFLRYYNWGVAYSDLHYAKTGGRGPMIVFFLMGEWNPRVKPQMKNQYYYEQQYIRISKEQYSQLAKYRKFANQKKDIDTHVSNMKHLGDTIMVWAGEDEGKIEFKYDYHCKIN